MSIYNGKRLDAEVFQIDKERMRKGWYSDAYFSNIVDILSALASEGYTFPTDRQLQDVKVDLRECEPIKTGNLVAEMQFFTRRQPFSMVAGVDEALAILKECTGHFDEVSGEFVNTYNDLEIEAVQDGTFVYYEGKPENVQPVLKIRGRYRDFARLETPIVGALTETTRIATNVYNVLVAMGGKDLLFFPARFAHYKLQALQGYAYALAVQGYNHKHDKNCGLMVSTDYQGAWWGGKGGGTIAHSSIACFLGDSSETMLQFARLIPPEVPRIALIDFHNDCIRDARKVVTEMFEQYWRAYELGDLEEAKKYKLYGVRPDTSGNMRDLSLEPLGDPKLDCGVNPRLVCKIREAIDSCYLDWDLGEAAVEVARDWCRSVKIVVTGGFNVARIKLFEQLGVPVDVYGVGSSLLENSSENGTNNDYTADIVRVRLDSNWIKMSKAGRKPGENKQLELIK